MKLHKISFRHLNIAFRGHLLINFACLVSLLAWSPGSYARSASPSEVPEYTLDQCIELGINNSIPLANARRDAQVAETIVRQVRAQVYPQLSTHAAYTRLDKRSEVSVGEESYEVGELDNYSVSFDASQLLYSGGSVQAALDAAKHYREQAIFGVEAERNMLIRDISVSFFDILLAQAKVIVQEESVEQYRQLATEAEKKYQFDTASEFDVLSAKVKVANEIPLVIQAKRNVEVAKASFRNLLYLHTEDFNIEGELEYNPVTFSLTELRKAALANRPEIIQQQKAIELARSDIRVERGSYFPEIKANGAYTGEDPSSRSSSEGWDWGWNVGLTLDWDLLDGGLRRATVAEKALELAIAEANLAQLERDVLLEVKTYFLDLEMSAEAVRASRDTVGLAKKSLDIAKARYDAGLSTYLEYSDANLELSRARLIRNTALSEHMTALAQLQYACGLNNDAFFDLAKPEEE